MAPGCDLICTLIALTLLCYIKLQEPCVLYIGRAYRCPPYVAFYIFFKTNISTEYFKHAAHSPYSLQNTVYFIMLPFMVPVLFTFYIQVC
jgi:hypothetical protein